MPGTFVARASSTRIMPCGSVATPAVSSPEIVGVRAAPHGEENVRAELFRRSLGSVDMHGDVSVAAAEADAFGMGANVDPLRLEDIVQRYGNVRVLGANDPSALLYDRDLRAEPAEGMGEFEADLAASDDDEVLGQPWSRQHAVQLSQRLV